MGDPVTDDAAFIRTVSQIEKLVHVYPNPSVEDCPSLYVGVRVPLLQEDVVCLACTTGAGVSYKSYLSGYGFASQVCSIDREPTPGVSYACCVPSARSTVVVSLDVVD